ncbi:protein misato homolog 1 [Protopterus annectens]|uniref:protein misato homolog 1 n=1 Tax=Protopterus annectens TaxID=7888 RepID=UPI001CF99874|nr:protein misato homolog 1 [Protopterus annectens]
MDIKCREVVTLQFGNYANFVGTHWWNLQDASLSYESKQQQCCEIDSGVLFREGQNLSGHPTYTPRLILMDLKGSLTSLKQEGLLYSDGKHNSSLTWEGNVAVHREEPAVKSSFLKGPETLDEQLTADHSSKTLSDCKGIPKTGVVSQAFDASKKSLGLENSVQLWSDYLQVHLHPRTISVIHDYSHDEQSSQFAAFGQGEGLFNCPRFQDDLEDRLHFFVEECDYLQGFQVLCDLHNGFSGLSAKTVELLQDEYHGKGILTCGVTPFSGADPSLPKNIYRLINTVLGIVSLSSDSSLFCPLSVNRNMGRRSLLTTTFPYVIYDASLNYQTSALLATALETMTLPYRLHTFPVSMSQLTDTMCSSGRKVVVAQASIPFPMKYSSTLPDVLSIHPDATLWQTLSPCAEFKDLRCFAQSVVLRGINRPNQVSHLRPGIEPDSVLQMYTSGEEVLGAYLHNLNPSTLSTALHLIESPCRLAASYPQIFTSQVNRRGFLQESKSETAVKSIPVLTRLQSSPVLHKVLSSLYEEVNALDIRRYSSFISAGTELDEFREALQKLRSLSQLYKMSFNLDESDDDSDTD